MIIILDKKEVIGTYAPVARHAPLIELDTCDFLSGKQITQELYDQATLFIITDAENNQFRVFKDDRNVFEEGKLYTTGEIGGWVWLYHSRHLSAIKQEWLGEE